MLEDRVTPLEILIGARKQFEQDIATPESFVTWRGLRQRGVPVEENLDELVEGYINILPRYQGNDIIELVDKAIEDRTSASDKITIVDIGYGNGSFLLDARKEWGDQLRLIGYGNDGYTKIPQRTHLARAQGGYYLPPTQTQLEEAGIELINGNAIDIRDKLGDNTADFIVSCYGLTNVEFPHWELLKKVYRSLKPGGIALIHPFYDLHILMTVQDYLLEMGYDFTINLDGVSFKKTLPDIKIPVWTQWPKEDPARIIIGSSVGERGLEPPTSRSQTARSTN
jgi:SAM-dependent methyltransferase